jgi:hypothetical protein
VRRASWRRRPWQPARRCPWCGWAAPDPLSGKVYGKHDPRFVGHAWACPSSLYRDIRTAAEVADQWQALEVGARLAAAADVPQWAELWRQMSWALMLRADDLGVPFPVCDDPRELAAP